MFYTILCAITSKNFFSIWLFLEMNIIRFLLWGVLRNNYVSIVKYFIIQRFFSLILIFTFFVRMSLYNPKIFNILFCIVIFRKLGTPPFFYWFINLSQTSSFLSLFFISSIQKIIPLVIAFSSLIVNYFFWIWINLFVIGVRIHRLMNRKKIIAYSSIFHIAWVLLALSNFQVMIIFIGIYSMNLFFFIKALILTNKIKSISNSFTVRLAPRIIFFNFLILLNIIGVPPFWGFLGKLIIIEMFFECNFSQFILLAMILVINTLIIFLYIRVMFFSLLVNNIVLFLIRHKYNYTPILLLRLNFTSFFWLI